MTASFLPLGPYNFLNHLCRRSWLVNTERFLGEKISRCGKRTSAAAHANVTEFAAAALPFQIVVMAELMEDCRVGPNVGKALLAQVARKRRSVTAGEAFSFVRDEAHASSGQAAFCHGVHIVWPPRMAGVSGGHPVPWLQRDSRG